MKKILDLLEQKVQWIVLALGVGYAVYTALVYLVAPPVQVEGIAPDRALSPGEVDQYIYDNVGSQLEAKLDGTGSVQVSPSNPMKDWEDRVSYAKEPAEPLKNVRVAWGTVNPVKIDVAPTPGQGPGPGPIVAAKQVVEKLPEFVSAPKLAGVKSGISHVQPFDPNNPGAGVTPGATGTDVIWASVRFEVDPVGIAQQFQAAKIPAEVQLTSFLKVELQREERMPDGSWGNPTIVKPAATQILQPIPADTEGANAKWQHLQWANQNVVMIMQPPFYTVIKGDQWTVPGEVDPMAAQQFSPEQYLDAPASELLKLTMEQRRQVAAAKAKRDAEAAKGRRGTGTGGGRPTGPRGMPGGIPGGEGGPDFAPPDPARPPGFPPYPGAGGEFYPPEGDMPGMGPGFQGQQTANFPLPQGQFDPSKWVATNPQHPTIVGWAHDDSVEPGRTYRYRVRYAIANPVFVRVDLVKNREDADRYAWWSNRSDWSEEINTLSTLNFYVAGAPRPGDSSIRIQLFRWQEGEVKTKTFVHGAGDQVGGVDGEVNYSTGWTLVDVRNDGRDDYILLLDPQGYLRRRDVRGDQSDPNFQRLKEQAAAAVAAASPTGTAMPGR